MKKLLVLGKNINPSFWTKHIGVIDVEILMYEGKETANSIIESNADVVVIDEYFHGIEYVDAIKYCKENDITHYIFSNYEDPSNRRWNLCRNILDEINEKLVTELV